MSETRLTFVREDGRQGSNVMWICRCVCGVVVRVRASRVRSGTTTSCGCYAAECTAQRNAKHGHNARGKRSPTYATWAAMHARCYKPTAAAYPWYGARGITVCERWKSFEMFLEDMGNRPDGMTLDRVDVDGSYEPSNCRWATQLEQARTSRHTILTAALADEARKRVALGESCASVARSMNVTRTAISRIIHGKNWVQP